MKISVISAAIAHGYIGIRFGHSNPLIGAYFAFAYVALFCEYGGTFHRAYRLAEGQKRFKKELRKACGRGVVNGSLRGELMRGVRALRCPSIRVGSFYEMERNSVLIFVSFVQTHLVSMLVSM